MERFCDRSFAHCFPTGFRLHLFGRLATSTKASPGRIGFPCATARRFASPGIPKTQRKQEGFFFASLRDDLISHTFSSIFPNAKSACPVRRGESGSHRDVSPSLLLYRDNCFS